MIHLLLYSGAQNFQVPMEMRPFPLICPEEVAFNAQERSELIGRIECFVAALRDIIGRGLPLSTRSSPRKEMRCGGCVTQLLSRRCGAIRLERQWLQKGRSLEIDWMSMSMNIGVEPLLWRDLGADII